MAEAAFLRAARDGNFQVIRKIAKNLEKKHLSTSAFWDAERFTGLHLAAMGGHTSVCEVLIEELDHERLDPRNSYGETPLYLAVMNGHDRTAIYLIKKGADALVKSDMGFTLLHQASKLGQIDLMNLLIAKGVNVEAGAYHIGTPLFCAAASGKLEAVNLLLNRNAKLNTSTADFLSPLVAAASFGSLPCVQALVEGGANLDDISTISEDLTGPNKEIYQFLDARKEERDRKMVKKSLPQKIVSSNHGNKLRQNKLIMELSDKAIKDKLTEMLADGERIFFSDWNSLQMKLFYKSTLVSLKRPQILDINDLNIKNSVICDLTDENKAQASFYRAICCYRAWQFGGTDLAYQFGDKGPRVSVSRKDNTFIFWFRNGIIDVGVVINGQALWSEGFLRRRFDAEKAEFVYSHPIQFRKEETAKDEWGRKVNLEKESAANESFLVADDLEVVDYSGSYMGYVSNLNLHLSKLRVSVNKIFKHKKRIKNVEGVEGASFEKTCHMSADRLVLYSTESGKNEIVFEYATFSLSPELPAKTSVKIPSCIDATVTKHKKISRRALLAIKNRVGRTGEYQKDEEYQIVPGAPFRALAQVVTAYTIFRREVVLPTKFFLDSKEYEKNLKSCLEESSCDGTPEQIQTEDSEKEEEIQIESEEEKERKILEKQLQRGTLYDANIHGGHETYEGPLHWPMPKRPCSKKKWYYYKVIQQDSSGPIAIS